MAHIHTDHCHSQAERIAEAEALCRRNGARFTDMRRTVFEFLLDRRAPVTAYDLLAALQLKLEKPLAPPTVYRALDFLLGQRLIHKLESNSSYLICDHPGEAHESLYLVCTACGTTRELEDAGLEALLGARAAAVGFIPARQVIEVQGLCASCSNAAGKSA
jgi:Fur family transcriptional regulator, zinc uptake regulator